MNKLLALITVALAIAYCELYRRHEKEVSYMRAIIAEAYEHGAFAYRLDECGE